MPDSIEDDYTGSKGFKVGSNTTVVFEFVRCGDANLEYTFKKSFTPDVDLPDFMTYSDGALSIKPNSNF